MYRVIGAGCPHQNTITQFIVVCTFHKAFMKKDYNLLIVYYTFKSSQPLGYF